MKKKFSMLLLVACLTVSLTGCGTKDDVKVISKDSPTKEADSSAEQEKSSNQKKKQTIQITILKKILMRLPLRKILLLQKKWRKQIYLLSQI